MGQRAAGQLADGEGSVAGEGFSGDLGCGIQRGCQWQVLAVRKKGVDGRGDCRGDKQPIHFLKHAAQMGGGESVSEALRSMRWKGWMSQHRDEPCGKQSWKNVGMHT